jgi:hypothetical protein
VQHRPAGFVGSGSGQILESPMFFIVGATGAPGQKLVLEKD